MAWKNCNWMSVPLITLIAGCGWMQPKERQIRYSEEPPVTSLRPVIVGGDFALFYAGQDKPEVPVRVKSGDSVGFLREDDGRLKAVAGPFKMDMDPAVREAFWKRMTFIDD